MLIKKHIPKNLLFSIDSIFPISLVILVISEPFSCLIYIFP